jgi:YHS domain-containing protein
MALTRECGSRSPRASDHPACGDFRGRGLHGLRVLRGCARAAALAAVAFAAPAAMLASPVFTGPAVAASPDTTAAPMRGAGAARLSLLPPLVGASEGVRRHDQAGVALEGFDPITYFLGDVPRPGDAAYEAVWNGHAWRFSSAANRAAFLSRPEVYAPRLGGNDALAMTEGRVVEAQARIAAIVDGGLYLFHTRAARDAFLADPGAAARAERIWNESRERMARL